VTGAWKIRLWVFEIRDVRVMGRKEDDFHVWPIIARGFPSIQEINVWSDVKA